MSDDAFRLSEEHQHLREVVRKLAKSEILPHAAEADERAEFPQASYDALVRADLHAPHLPVEHSGMGADALATCLVIEEVARVCASTSLVPAVNKLGTMPLLLAGDPSMNARYLTPVARGEAMFAYGLSERDAGSDTASMVSRAVRTGNGWVLNGQKSWITNAGIADYYTVMAVTDPSAGKGGISAFVVEKGDPGFTFGAPERKMGIQGSPTRELLFDDVPLPADRLVGGEGQGLALALRTLDHTRITIGAQAVGIAQGALDVAAGYVTERRQFGKAIADFQGIQFLLADMAMKLEAARALVYVAAGMSERNDREVGYFGAAAKCVASDAAMAITTDAVQLLGGYGYTRDFPLERMMRDAKITQIYEGTNQIQRIVVARRLLARGTRHSDR